MLCTRSILLSIPFFQRIMYFSLVLAVPSFDYHLSFGLLFQAVEIDNSDITVWFRIGRIAMRIADLNLAISAFLEVK